MDNKALYELINSKLNNHDTKDIPAIMDKYKDIAKYDGGLATVWYMCYVFNKEVADSYRTVFDKVTSIDELIQRNTTLKFLLRRLEYDYLEDKNELLCFIKDNDVSIYELLGVIDSYCRNRDNVLSKLK